MDRSEKGYLTKGTCFVYVFFLLATNDLFLCLFVDKSFLQDLNCIIQDTPCLLKYSMDDGSTASFGTPALGQTQKGILKASPLYLPKQIMVVYICIRFSSNFILPYCKAIKNWT